MRLSPQRHPLARLRLFLGLGQKEMADLLGCSKSTIQQIELVKMAISPSLAARATQITGISGQWLRDANPKTPMVNDKEQKYSAKDFFVSYVQTTQFKHAKEPHVRQILEWHSQWCALELEEILNRAVNRNKWPVIKLHWTEFRNKALQAMGEKQRKVEFDYSRAAASFSSRWEKQDEDSSAERIKRLQEDAIKIVEGKKVTFSDTILAKIRNRHRDAAGKYWEPVMAKLHAKKR